MPASSQDIIGYQQDDFVEICRQAGLKLTHQRMIIHAELAACKDHPSAETIHTRVKSSIPTISLDTVYRTLATFEDIGAVVRIDVSEGPVRYDADLSPHHHCICTRCKAIKDFRWETFDVMGLPEETGGWGRIMSKNVVLRGLCRECLTCGGAEGL